MTRNLHLLATTWNSLRRRFSTAMWRAVLGGLGRGSTIGPRWTIERPSAVIVGDGVVMGSDGWISVDPEADDQMRITIGGGCYIGNYFLVALSRKIEIGKKVMISDRVFIGDCNHRAALPSIPVIDQGLAFGGEVKIGHGSWIGVGAAILPGVTIGENCVVGANSVVTHDVADGKIVGGAPARPLRP